MSNTKFLRKMKRKAKRDASWKLFTQHTSRIIVLFSITIVLIFTAVCLYMQYKTNMDVSSTLIDNFYQFFGYEMLILGGIKVSKNVKDVLMGKIENTIDQTNTESEDFEV